VNEIIEKYFDSSGISKHFVLLLISSEITVVIFAEKVVQNEMSFPKELESDVDERR